MYPISYLYVDEAYRRPPIVLENQTTLGVELIQASASRYFTLLMPRVNSVQNTDEGRSRIFYPVAQFIVQKIFTDLKTGLLCCSKSRPLECIFSAYTDRQGSGSHFLNLDHM